MSDCFTWFGVKGDIRIGSGLPASLNGKTRSAKAEKPSWSRYVSSKK